jgi:hypothetical protein
VRRGGAFHRHFRHVVYGESPLARSGHVPSQKRAPGISESSPRV